MISILYVANKKDVFLKGFLQNLDHKIYQFYLLDLANGELIDIQSGNINKIIAINEKYLRFIRYGLRYMGAFLIIIRFNNLKFDLVHFLNIKRENFYLIPFFRKRCKKLLLTVYGRSTYTFPTKKILFSWVYKYIDLIIFSNHSVIKEFILANPNIPPERMIQLIPPLGNIRLTYPNNQDIHTTNFIKQHNINRNLISVFCSSSASPNDQHEKIIEALKNIKSKEKVQLIFMLTYGGSVKERLRINEKIKLELKGFNVKIFESFIEDQELKVLRSITDIYLNMRKSDQLAGAVLESLNEGALLLSGNWLKYETLDVLGVHYWKVNGFAELSETLDMCIENFDLLRKNYAEFNKQIIAKAFSLENILNKWNALYRN